MHMHSRLFPREEIKPIAAIPENCRTHPGIIPEMPDNSTMFPTASKTRERFGLRWQSAAATPLSSGRQIFDRPETSVRAKAAWRFASRRRLSETVGCECVVAAGAGRPPQRLARGGAALDGIIKFLAAGAARAGTFSRGHKIIFGVCLIPLRRWSRRRPSAGGVPWSAFRPRR